MILRRIIFSISRKILKIFLMLSASSFSIKIQYFIYYFSENKENELFKLKQLISSKGNAIDIGCNKGLFSYALSKQSKIIKIFSFEPNKFILNDLKNYNCKNIKIFNYALSNKEKNENLIIPYYKRFELDGFATLEKKILLNQKFRKFKKINIKTKKLDNFNFKNISFIKIDVEGHEISLLNGAKKIFKANKPNCLIEIKKGNLFKVKKFFKSIDSKYKCISKKKFSFKFSQENYFFSTDSK